MLVIEVAKENVLISMRSKKVARFEAGAKLGMDMVVSNILS